MVTKKEKDVNKEITQLKECVKEKDNRLKKQAMRIETIESRHSTILWSIIISSVVSGFILLGYTMTHIYSTLPDAVEGLGNGKGYAFMDPLQFFGFYIICFLAFIGLIALLFYAYIIITGMNRDAERLRKSYYDIED